MGKFVKLHPGTVRVSQNFVKDGTLGYIIRCYEENRLEDLPPEPILRTATDGSFVAIDGHNLLVVDDLLGNETKVYIADGPDDSIAGPGKGIDERNADLKAKYHSALGEADQLRDGDIATVRHLRLKHTYLKDAKTAREHYLE